jgi:predicted phage terminase large subunit-like protein
MLHDRSEGDDPMSAARIARQNAMSFYAENRAEMTRGADVLWPERLDLLSLMEKRAIKRLAFNSEYQNEPIDEDSRIFHTIRFYDPGDVNMRDLEIYGAVDPSMGNSKRSDPSVIITVGRHKRSGVIYVLDVDVKRRHPDQIIQDVFTKARTFDYVAFSVEAVAFQQFMKDELMKRSAEQGVYIPAKEFKSTVKKEIRIAAIEPLVSSGYIRILPNQRDLIEQMEYFPKAAHDDAIDALAQVMELAKKRGSGLTFGKI